MWVGNRNVGVELFYRALLSTGLVDIDNPMNNVGETFRTIFIYIFCITSKMAIMAYRRETKVTNTKIRLTT